MERPPDFRPNLSSLVVWFVKKYKVNSVDRVRSCVVFFRHVRFCIRSSTCVGDRERIE